MLTGVLWWASIGLDKSQTRGLRTMEQLLQATGKKETAFRKRENFSLGVDHVGHLGWNTDSINMLYIAHRASKATADSWALPALSTVRNFIPCEYLEKQSEDSAFASTRANVIWPLVQVGRANMTRSLNISNAVLLSEKYLWGFLLYIAQTSSARIHLTGKCARSISAEAESVYSDILRENCILQIRDTLLTTKSFCQTNLQGAGSTQIRKIFSLFTVFYYFNSSKKRFKRRKKGTPKFNYKSLFTAKQLSEFL